MDGLKFHPWGQESNPQKWGLGQFGTQGLEFADSLHKNGAGRIFTRLHLGIELLYSDEDGQRAENRAAAGDNPVHLVIARIRRGQHVNDDVNRIVNSNR